MIITPKRESRFSFREMKGVLEEIDCFGFLNISREVGFYIVTSENIKNIKVKTRLSIRGRLERQNKTTNLYQHL